MDNISIFIADNQSFTRIGVSSILQGYLNNHLIILHIKTKEELHSKLILDKPHILIIDYDFFDYNSPGELSEIKRIHPSLGILVITDNNSTENVLKVLDSGITNYILKTCDEQELIEAFNATINGRKYFSSDILNVLLDGKSNYRNAHPLSGKLTPAELEIIKYIAQGFTTKEIATQKKLSYHTINTHRKNIFRKLNINSISELIMYALRIGIIDTTEYYI